jgi:uncharacterized damage-inducible protein DinB
MAKEAARGGAVVEMLVERMEWVRSFTQALACPLTDAQVVHRAGGKGNHALWVMGHMAVTDDFFLHLFSGQPRRLERWDGLFAGGSEPKDSLDAYPPRSEIEAAFREAHARVKAWARSASEAELDTRLTGDMVKFAPTVRAALVSMGAHEFFHAGQVAACRSSLGLARVMM